jgi:VWFA-related protein
MITACARLIAIISVIGTLALHVPAPLTLRVTVERPDGTPVAGLTAADFDLSLDGVAQAITSVSAADVPVSVVLLIDVSASMNMGDVASGVVLQRALEQWFPLSLRRDDRARVGSIGRRVTLSDRFTSDKREMVAAGFAARTVAAVDRIGPSPIWDGIEAAVNALEWESGPRAVIVLTDGRATGNRVSLRGAGEHAMASAVEIHVVAERDAPIGIPQLDGNLTHVMPGISLRWLAETTGGSYVTDKKFPWSDPGPLFEQAVKRVHRAYTMTFQPRSSDDKVHSVDIRVKSPGLTVRARKQLLASR